MFSKIVSDLIKKRVDEIKDTYKPLKLKNVKAVCGDTKWLRGCYGNIWYELAVNKRTGTVFYQEFCGSVGSSWTNYSNEDIVVVGNVCNPMTMQEIKKMVYDVIGCTPRHEAREYVFEKIKEEQQKAWDAIENDNPGCSDYDIYDKWVAWGNNRYGEKDISDWIII